MVKPDHSIEDSILYQWIILKIKKVYSSGISTSSMDKEDLIVVCLKMNCLWDGIERTECVDSRISNSTAVC